MIRLNLFLACQHLKWGKNLRECEDQSWFKVQVVPLFRFDWYKIFSRASYDVFECPRLKTTPLDDLMGFKFTFRDEKT
jgi:hypothetical protein